MGFKKVKFNKAKSESSNGSKRRGKLEPIKKPKYKKKW